MTKIALNNEQALRKFLASKNVNQKTLQSMDKDKDGVSLQELSTYYSSDKVSISPAAFAAVAGEDGVLDEADLSKPDKSSGGAGDAAPVGDEPLAGPGLSLPTLLRMKYVGMANIPRAVLPKLETEKAIEEIGKKGGFNKKDFCDTFKVDMTDEAWKKFTGLEKASARIDLETLSQRMDTMTEFIEGTGQPWFHFVDCDRFTIIPMGATLASVFKGMSKSEQLEFIKLNRHDLLNNYPSKMDDAEILSDLLSFKSEDDKEARTVRVLLQRAFNELYMEMKKKGYEVDLSDPTVAERFAKTAFKTYLTSGDKPTQAAAKVYTQQTKAMKKVRKLFGPEKAAELLAQVNVEDKDFDKVMEEVTEILGDKKKSDEAKKTEIDGLLKQLPKADGEAAPDKPAKKA